MFQTEGGKEAISEETTSEHIPELRNNRSHTM